MEKRIIYLTVKIEVELPNNTDKDNDEIVSELDYNIESFDNEVKIIDTEITDFTEEEI